MFRMAFLLMATVVAPASSAVAETQTLTGSQLKIELHPNNGSVQSKMMGTWEAVSLHAEGKDANQEFLKGLRIEIGSDSIVVSQPGNPSMRFCWKVQEGSGPHSIDMEYHQSFGKVQKMLGILECDGLTLRWAVTTGGERPTSFLATGDPCISILVLRRVK